jgi:hypothetical protein
MLKFVLCKFFVYLEHKWLINILGLKKYLERKTEKWEMLKKVHQKRRMENVQKFRSKQSILMKAIV